MRRVAQHVSPLAQRIKYQSQVHLLQIAHAAMDELGTPAGRLLGEIGAFHKQSAIASRSSLDCAAEAGRSAANNQHIPWRSCSSQLAQDFLSCNQAFPFLSNSGKQRNLGQSAARRTRKYAECARKTMHRRLQSSWIVIMSPELWSLSGRRHDWSCKPQGPAGQDCPGRQAERCRLEADFQRELNYARRKGAADKAASRRVRTLRAANGGRQVEIGVIKDVVQLGTKLDLHAFSGRVEALVEVEIGLIERGCATRVARHIAEWRLNGAIGVVDRGQRDGLVIDVLDIAGGG